MRRSVIVVDDFYDDPAEIRAQAVGSAYFPRGTTAYLRSTEIRCDADSLRRIAWALGAPAVQQAPKYTSGGFRLSNPETPKTNDIHVDFGAEWNVIVYLTPGERENGGTSLWRHRATELDAMPHPELMRAKGFADVDDFMRRVGEDGMHRDRWIETMRIPWRYNRMAAIDSLLFHSMTGDFGKTIDDSRIIQVFFVSSAAA